MNDNSSQRTFSPLAARIFGVAVIAAPLLMLASTIGYVVEGEGVNEGVLGGTIGVWSSFALVIGFAGVLRLLESRAPRAAPILTIFALTGFAAGIAFNIQAIFVAILGPELDAALDAAIEDGSGAVSILAWLPWGWFAPISFVLVGIFLWRTRTTAWWTGALLILGGVLFVASRMERMDPLALATDGVLILALVPIGWAILTSARQPAPAPVPVSDRS